MEGVERGYGERYTGQTGTRRGEGGRGLMLD